MAENTDQERHITGHFFTSARRFKQVLGSLPDGTRIPGGPYTYSQVGVALGVVILGWLTRGLWGTASGIGDLLILVIIGIGSAVLIGRLPQGRRSPLRLAGSMFALLTHPGPGGRWKGRPLKLSPTAQRIRRKQKTAAKKAARTATRTKKKITPPPEAPPQKETPVMPAGYGSSLNRLLADHGLTTERTD